MEKLTIDEIHAHLPGTVKALDKVCRKNNIPIIL